MDEPEVFASRMVENKRREYSKNYMREYRKEKNYDLNRWRLLHLCKTEKRIPTKQSINKYNITKEELNDLIQNYLL